MSAFAVWSAAHPMTYEGFFPNFSTSALWGLLFALLFILLKEAFEKNSRRLTVTALSVSLVLSLCRLFGAGLQIQGSILWVFRNGETLFWGFSYFFGFAIICFAFVSFLFRKADEFVFSAPERFSWKRAALMTLCLMLAWLPWFLSQYPGILSVDSRNQMRTALGLDPMADYHPVFHTLLIRWALVIGRALFGTNQEGTAVYSVLQMLFMALSFSVSLELVRKYQVSRFFRVTAFLWFALYPVHGTFAITMWKDILYSGAVLAYTALLFYALMEKQKSGNCVFYQKRYCFLLVFFSLLMPFLRHNGFYALVLSVPFLALALPEQRKAYIILSAVSVIFYLGVRNVLFPALGVLPGRAVEMLSVPLQQIGMTFKRHKDVFTDKEWDMIHRYFTGDELGAIYNPMWADRMKIPFNSQAYDEDKTGFFEMWAHFGAKYWKDYIDALLYNCYGYWYPEAENYVFIFGVDNELGDVYEDPIWNPQWMRDYREWLDHSEFYRQPLLSLLFSPGAYFWLLLIAFAYCVYRRSPLAMLFMPCFFTWLTALGSPVFCEYRYLYPLVVSSPLLTGGILPGCRDDCSTK